MFIAVLWIIKTNQNNKTYENFQRTPLAFEKIPYKMILLEEEAKILLSTKYGYKYKASNNLIIILELPKLYFCAGNKEIFRNLFVSLDLFDSFWGNAKKNAPFSPFTENHKREFLNRGIPYITILSVSKVSEGHYKFTNNKNNNRGFAFQNMPYK